MKNIIIFICLILNTILSFGQAVVVFPNVSFKGNDKLEAVIGAEGNIVTVYYQLMSGTEKYSEDMLRNTLSERANWIEIYEEFSNGILKLRVHPNLTSVERTCSIMSNYMNYRFLITQKPAANIKVFNVSGERKIIDGQVCEITLDGSEIGVAYSLLEDGKVVQSKDGTGNALIFSIPCYYGRSYSVLGTKDGKNRNMEGTVDFTYYPVYGNISLENSIVDLLAEGDGTTVRYMFLNVGDNIDAYRNNILEIINLCNAGKIESWNPEFQLREMRLSATEGYLFIIASPNISSKIRESYLYFGYQAQRIEITQESGGNVKRFNVWGDGCIILGQKFSVKLDGSQTLKYCLYRNGAKTSISFLGTGHGFSFSNLTEPGEYTIKAECDGQTFDMNGSVLVRDINITPPYIEEKTRTGDGNMVRDIAYYDGSGRLVQQVGVGASPGGKDIITPVVRDNVGREAVNYLSFAIDGSGNYRTRAVAEQNTFFTSLYGNNPVAYTSRRFDNGPNDKVIEQSAPGYSWRIDGGHTIRFSYRKNMASDKVKRYVLEGSSLRINETPWSAEGLSVKEVTGTQGDVMLEYRDVQGDLVAKESRLSDGKSLFTYEVRDVQGHLRYVVPPLQDSLFTSGTKTFAELSRYCYYMEYDEFGRVYKQHNPGAGFVINLYDKRGRLVFVQDEKQRKNNTWSFTKYDELDRPVISGICTGTESGHKAGLESQTVFGEQRGTDLHGYTNKTYPTAVSTADCFIITYYDDYKWSGQTAVAYSATDAIGGVKSDDVLGLVTGTKTKVLGVTTDQWLLSAEYYDQKYHSVQSVSQLYPSGTEVTSNAHDQAGQVTRAKVKQTIGSVVTEYNKYFTYDQRGRVLKIEQQITGDNNNGRVTLVENVYDELGQVSSRKLHNSKEIQSFGYNVNGSVASVTSPAFSYTLNYDRTNVTGASARYDGHINAMTWKNGSGSEKAYVYSYDLLGQLKAAAYKEKSGTNWLNSTGKYNVTGLSYDLNGNIKSLQRNNASGASLHALKYTYDATNNGNAISQIKFNNALSGTYVYDENGNMTTDGHRGITVTYNALDLPSVISKGQTKISYIYSAKGEKLAQEVTTTVGSSLTYYRGVMVYNGNSLDYILHPEGMTRKVSSGYVYDYFLTDHLGSTRVMLEASGNTLVPVQTTEYYPFGLAFSANDLDKNKHLFSGKEIQNVTFGSEMLGMYDFGSRFYDPLVGRWFCQDPAAQLASPYGYCNNNPITFVDPDGEFIFGYLFGWFRGLLKGKNPFKEGFNTARNETKIMLGLLRTGGHQNIFQSAWEVISRFTWQIPQTLVGYGYANYLNYTSETKIDYYGGTTTISTSAMKNAVTLGNYISGNEDLEASPSNGLFQHEYGHYLQSKRFGPAYLPAFAIPSGLSVAKGNDHKYFRVEQDANARAIKYFNKRGVLDWNFRRNLIGNDPYRWDMSNIYEDASTRKFTDEFNSTLNSVMKKPSFGDYFALFTSPLGVYVVGNTHYNSYDNIDWSVAKLNRVPKVSTGTIR